ncbi:lipase family protein [Rhodococcus triatomae]
MRWTAVLPVVLVAMAVAVAGPPAHADPVTGPPGSVVEVGPLDPAAMLPGAADGYRVVYRTTDHHGAGRLSSGAVYVPPGPVPDRGWPVVSYAHGTIGLADGCEPSTVGGLAEEGAYMDRWLRRGYAVVATDYAGLGTPGELAYLDGVAAGHGVVDMVRAGRAAMPELSSRWVVAGLSQGGHAALHTAHLATTYAPELDYRGAVSLAPPTNLEQVFPFAGPGVPNFGVAGLTKFTLFTMVGLADARPDLDIPSRLSPRGRELATLATQVCTVEVGRRIGKMQVGELFSRPIDDLRPALADYIGVPTSGYDRPVLIGQGAVDLVVPMPLTLLFAQQLASVNTRFDLRLYPSADHIGVLAASFDDAAAVVDGLVS